MSHYEISPAEFKHFVEDFGVLSAVANIASMIEARGELDPVSKDYLLIEAKRLLRAIEAATEVDGE